MAEHPSVGFRRFMVHALSHTFVVVDISELGLPTEVYPTDGKEQVVSSRRFQSWRDTEKYFRGLGANASTLDEASGWLKRCGATVLTIREITGQESQ